VELTDASPWTADDQWERIKDFLPGREGHVGGTAAIAAIMPAGVAP